MNWPGIFWPSENYILRQQTEEMAENSAHIKRVVGMEIMFSLSPPPTGFLEAKMLHNLEQN